MNLKGSKVLTVFLCGADFNYHIPITDMRYLFSFILLSLSFGLFAQTDSISAIQADSLSLINTEAPNPVLELLNDIRYNQNKENEANRFKIYPTENIYILIKLDTQTGKLELIQWSLKSKDEFSATLNNDDLSWYSGLNSFELYPTKNMYQFILLDKATGRNWHVQWGTKSSEMWIRRIY